ncbi:hypothetical protein QN277_014027 [Acacia crassicarpa]|uniref:Uncharacterized protein n=1 Tax=Acacia crassicarpa TaxID=499986 RepID=A0AAE1TGC3_9FABA|nr:hypothetical protein QN277_014027 [Acacia crassicarpa]
MGQRRSSSSSSLMSIFNIFWSGARREECHSSVDEGTAAMQGCAKVRKSDEDKGQWGPSEPDIDVKAAAFIARYRQKVTESEVHQFPPQLK